jgi:predicted DNA-binding WGR domain protein
VRTRDDGHYTVGVIVDTAAHYLNPDVAERCVTQPGILRAFGWRVALVLTRDWYHEPQAVVDRIERLVRDEAEPPIEFEDDLPPPVRPPAPAPPPSSAPLPTASSPQPVTPAASASDAKFRRLELVEGPSAKFWEIAQDGTSVVVRFGRIGTHGQSQTKVFDTPERAAREVEKLTTEKIRKGYRDALV